MNPKPLADNLYNNQENKLTNHKEREMAKNTDLFLACAAKLISATYEKYPSLTSPDLEALTGKKYKYFDEPFDGVEQDAEHDLMQDTANRLLELGFLHTPRADERGILWNCGCCLTPFTMGKPTFAKLFGNILDDSTIGDRINTAVKEGAKSELPKLMSKGFSELCKFAIMT